MEGASLRASASASSSACALAQGTPMQRPLGSCVAREAARLALRALGAVLGAVSDQMDRSGAWERGGGRPVQDALHHACSAAAADCWHERRHERPLSTALAYYGVYSIGVKPNISMRIGICISVRTCTLHGTHTIRSDPIRSH